MGALSTPKLIGLDDYVPVVGQAEIDEMRAVPAWLGGRRVKMVSPPAVGGGVAGILTRLVPLMADVGVPTRWDIITGGDDFFAVTKGFHNALHGAAYEPTPQAF